MVYSLGTDVLGAGLNGEKRLEMRYMVGCKDGGLSFVYIRSLCYRSVRALARFVADSVVLWEILIRKPYGLPEKCSSYSELGAYKSAYKR